MNRDDIKAILPHREPMLLIDEAQRLDDGSARASYTVRGDEFFLQVAVHINKQIATTEQVESGERRVFNDILLGEYQHVANVLIDP